MKSTSWGSVGQVRQQRVHAVDEPARQLLRRDAEEVVDVDARHPQPGGRDQHQTSQPVLLLDGEAGRQQTAEREADEVDVAGQAELVEQLDVVEHEVVHLAQPVEVARLAEARVVRDQHAVLRGPRLGEGPPVEGARPRGRTRAAAPRDRRPRARPSACR